MAGGFPSAAGRTELQVWERLCREQPCAGKGRAGKSWAWLSLFKPGRNCSNLSRSLGRAVKGCSQSPRISSKTNSTRPPPRPEQHQPSLAVPSASKQMAREGTLSFLPGRTETPSWQLPSAAQGTQKGFPHATSAATTVTKGPTGPQKLVKASGLGSEQGAAAGL